MQKAFSKLLLTGIIALVTLLACSPNDSSNMPYQPPAQVRGKIAIINESSVVIQILGYTQQRGDTLLTMNLGVHLFPDHNYYLRNLIEYNMGQIFQGGDIVKVSYMADAPDPDDPSQPLFRNTIELTVNGTFYIQVKNGGVYSIAPG